MSNKYLKFVDIALQITRYSRFPLYSCKYSKQTYTQHQLLTLILFKKYKYKVKNPDVGKTFKECYDLTTLEPTAEYRAKHTKVTKEIYDLMVNGLA